MRCLECGGEYVVRRGTLQVPDPYVGPLTVGPIEYMKCGKCGDYMFSGDAARRIEEAEETALQGILRSQPLGAFLSASETAALLGISRQALHKHRRIRRGFIFQTEFGGKTVYLKSSVDLFRKQGDGRFVLRQPETGVRYTDAARMPALLPWRPQTGIPMTPAGAYYPLVVDQTHSPKETHLWPGTRTST
jgi:hypothetical protein